VTGYLAQGRGLIRRSIAMLAGIAVVYAIGLPWLGLYVPADKLIALGFTPFIAGDLINIAMVALGAALIPARLLRKSNQ